MNELILEWCQFCEGKTTLDKSHFHTLFWEDITKKDLQMIFNYFPNSNELYEITNEYLFGIKHKDFYNPKINDILKELALLDIEQKIEILKLSKNNKLVDVIERVNLEYTQDFDFVIKDKTDDFYIDFKDEIEFYLSANWLLKDKKTYALYEAFYGLVKSKEMVWYLFKPLINVNVNFKYYYEFTILGGVYSLNENKGLVSRNPLYNNLK